MRGAFRPGQRQGLRDAIAAQTVAVQRCVQPNDVSLEAGNRAWGTIAWLPASPNPDIHIILDGQAGCPASVEGPTECPKVISAGVLYFWCNNSGGISAPRLHVKVTGTRGTRLGAFYVRSAAPHDGD